MSTEILRFVTEQTISFNRGDRNEQKFPYGYEKKVTFNRITNSEMTFTGRKVQLVKLEILQRNEQITVKTVQKFLHVADEPKQCL